MTNRYILLATTVLAIFFFIGGMLDILDHFLSKMILIAGFLAIVVCIIVIKSKDEDIL